MRSSSMLVLLAIFLATGTFAKEGVKVQPVDKNGVPTGKPIVLPDCRSCKAEKTGPNTYTVTIPKEKQRKLDDKVENAQRNQQK